MIALPRSKNSIHDIQMDIGGEVMGRAEESITISDLTT